MKATKKLDIMIGKKSLRQVVDVVQFDTGIQLELTAKDFTFPASGISATMYVQKPSGKFVYQDTKITVSGNKITIPVYNQAFAEPGICPFQVTIKEASTGDTITTFEAVFDVQVSRKDAAAEPSETVINAFEEAVEKAKEEISKGIDCDTTLTQEGKPADSKAVGEVTSRLSESIAEIVPYALVKERTKNLIDKDAVRVGFYWDTTRNEYHGSDNWYASDFIPVDETKQYKFSADFSNNGVMSHCYAFNSEKVYLGTCTATAGLVTPIVGTAFILFDTNNANTKAKLDTWQLEEGANRTPFEAYWKIIPYFDTRLAQGFGNSEKLVMSQKAITEAMKNVMQPSESNSLFAFKTQIPQYFVDNGDSLYISDKIEKIKSHKADLNIIFFTDPHWIWNQKNSAQLIGYVAESTGTDLVVNGGDILGNASNSPTREKAEYHIRQFQDVMNDVCKGKHYLYCFGNHDLNMAGASSLSETQRNAVRLTYDFIYKYMIAPYCDKFVFENGYDGVSQKDYWAKLHYYYDDDDKKVRIIVLDTGTPYNPIAEEVGNDSAVIYSQLDWLYSVLKGTPDGYKVITFGHQFFATPIKGFIGGASQVARILRACSTKSSYTGTYTHLNESVTKTFDFTDLNKDIDCIGMYCGHEHADYSGIWTGNSWNAYALGSTECANVGDVLVMVTDSDANIATHVDSSVDRTSGTNNEQCFDVFSFDFTNRILHCTRIGNGADRTYKF